MYRRMSDTCDVTSPTNGETNNMPAPVANPEVQPVVNPVQQTVFVQTAGNTRYKLSTKKFVGMGVTQIIIGTLCIILDITLLIMIRSTVGGASGIWCSVFFIVAGAFEISAGKSKHLCLVITCMVLCIISAVTAGILLFISVMSSVFLTHHPYYYHGDALMEFRISVTMAVLALAEVVLAIVTAGLCCRAVCCGVNAGQQPMVAYVPNQTGQVVILQNPSMPITSIPSGGAVAAYPSETDQVGELPQKSFPPDYVENPNFHQSNQSPSV